VGEKHRGDWQEFRGEVAGGALRGYCAFRKTERTGKKRKHASSSKTSTVRVSGSA